MNLSDIENVVLDLLLDDYEEPRIIAKNISTFIASPITEQEVLSILGSLAESGLVQPFIYDATTQQYMKIESALAHASQNIWFLATTTGREWAANNG